VKPAAVFLFLGLIGPALPAPAAHAEYRAFELVITDPAGGQERVEISTLDPAQYVMYHPIRPDERVTYRATWMCRGNTSHFKPICPNPKAQ
jgi:hypothetical protein